MTDTRQLNGTGRLILSVLCAALFFVIALEPYRLYMEFKGDMEVLLKIQAYVGFIFLLLWLLTVYGPLRTSALYAPGTAGTEQAVPRETATLGSKVFWIALQILVVPLLIIMVVGLMAAFS